MASDKAGFHLSDPARVSTSHAFTYLAFGTLPRGAQGLTPDPALMDLACRGEGAIWAARG